MYSTFFCVCQGQDKCKAPLTHTEKKCTEKSKLFFGGVSCVGFSFLFLFFPCVVGCFSSSSSPSVRWRRCLVAHCCGSSSAVRCPAPAVARRLPARSCRVLRSVSSSVVPSCGGSWRGAVCVGSSLLAFRSRVGFGGGSLGLLGLLRSACRCPSSSRCRSRLLGFRCPALISGNKNQKPKLDKNKLMVYNLVAARK